jgi:hypothetical protein
MLAAELNLVETSGMLGTHPELVSTPSIASLLNFLFSCLPQESVEEEVCLHGALEDLDQLSLFFVHPIEINLTVEHQALQLDMFAVSEYYSFIIPWVFLDNETKGGMAANLWEVF